MMQVTSDKQRRYSHSGLSTTSDVSGKSGVTGQQGPTERRRRFGITQVQHAPEMTIWNDRGNSTGETIHATTTERQRKKSHASFFSGTEVHQPLFATLQNVLSTSRTTIGHTTSDDTSLDNARERKSSSRKTSFDQPAGTEPYTVQTEDSLASIAACHGWTVSELTKLNRLMSSMIFPGQVLYVPSTCHHDNSTLDSGTSVHIAGGRLDVGHQPLPSMLETQTTTVKTNSEPIRRVSFYSDVHPDIGQLATAIEQIKKDAINGPNELEYLPMLSTVSSILEQQHLTKLAGQLPGSLEGRPWSLCYSADREGFSLLTLYRCTSNVDNGPCLLVVKDSQHQVFGAFLTCSLKQSEHFYDGGESFLYTFNPQFRKFPWTKFDDYFVRGDSEGLVIGGGGGVYGLWLDSDLYRGHSSRSRTFNNDPLTTSNDFTVSSVEIWTFEW